MPSGGCAVFFLCPPPLLCWVLVTLSPCFRTLLIATISNKHNRYFCQRAAVVVILASGQIESWCFAGDRTRAKEPSASTGPRPMCRPSCAMFAGSWGHVPRGRMGAPLPLCPELWAGLRTERQQRWQRNRRSQCQLGGQCQPVPSRGQPMLRLLRLLQLLLLRRQWLLHGRLSTISCQDPMTMEVLQRRRRDRLGHRRTLLLLGLHRRPRAGQL